MQLRNVHMLEQEGPKDLYLEGSRITHVVNTGDAASAVCLSFENALALPGLINSHDHLDFDLFPALASRVYNDYKEWGTDIHTRYAPEIASVLRVPRELRIRWGMYKNLLSGVTTVVHHGARLEAPKYPIDVLQDAESMHSVSGEKGWRRKLLSPWRRRRPVVIHSGEGATPICAEEVDRLIHWNLFGRPLIGIHGIAMNQRQAAAFQALVWCPYSNFFLYDKTADIPMLQTRMTVVFGTDSTLTASWNIWEHLRMARELRLVGDAALWAMVTSGPAHLWGLDNLGTLDEGQFADIVIADRSAGLSGWDAVFGLDPELLLLVLHRGRIRFFDSSLLEQLRNCAFPMENFYPVVVGGKVKYVYGDLPGLVRDIRSYHPDVALPVTVL